MQLLGIFVSQRWYPWLLLPLEKSLNGRKRRIWFISTPPPGCAQNRDFFLSSVHHEPFFEKLKVELFLVTPYSIGYAIREQTLFLK